MSQKISLQWPKFHILCSLFCNGISRHQGNTYFNLITWFSLLTLAIIFRILTKDENSKQDVFDAVQF